MFAIEPSALKQPSFRIAGVGRALGSARLTNAALSEELKIEPEWIETRCGISSRCIADEGETTYPLCPCAPVIALALGIPDIPAFDLNAACSGGVVGLLMALSFLASGFVHRVLLIASDTTTKHLARDDRQTRVLFGDAAAALAIETSTAADMHLIAWVMGSDGGGAGWFCVPEGGSATAVTAFQR